MQDPVKELEEIIEADKDALRAKKLMLAALKKDSVKKVSFSETKVGRTWYKTLRTVASPFVSVYVNAEDNLKNPERIQCRKLINQSEKLYQQAATCNPKNEKKAYHLTQKAAKHVIVLEDFLENSDNETLEDYSNKLMKEVERLRPPVDEEKRQEVLQQLEEMAVGLDNITQLACGELVEETQNA